MKRKVFITGAAGGMGRACARLLGATHDLILTDAAAEPLGRFADELRTDGCNILAALPGDLSSDALIAELTGHLAADCPAILVHTAGLSPAQADWQRIIAVNLVTTEKLLRAVEPLLAPGSVGVLIASAAGHMSLPMPDACDIVREPLTPDLIERLSPHFEAIAAHQGAAAAGGASYSLSKQAVIGMCEQRAAAWGRRGARIVSLSPGMILTSMGRRELAETQGATEMFGSVPAGRYGLAAEIAFAVEFLTSEKAAFITGTDLRIDGGWIATLKSAEAGRAGSMD